MNSLQIASIAKLLPSARQTKATKGGSVSFTSCTKKDFRIAHPNLTGNALSKAYEENAYGVKKALKKEGIAMLQEDRVTVRKITVNEKTQTGAMAFDVNALPELSPAEKTVNEASSLGIDVLALIAAKKAEIAKTTITVETTLTPTNS